jgi:subtilisin family serine protease
MKAVRQGLRHRELTMGAALRRLTSVQILKEFGKYGVLIVAAAGNDYFKIHNLPIPGYLPNGRGDSVDQLIPSTWGNPSDPRYLPHLLTVGATEPYSRVASFSPYQKWMTYAVGAKIFVAAPGGNNDIYKGDDGTSFGK